MSFKKILIGTACLALSACASHPPYYNTSVADADGNHGASQTKVAGWKLCYDTGRTKEWDLPPCENPQKVAPAPVVMQKHEVVATTTTTHKLMPIIHSYTLYFDLNKATIKSSEQAKLSQIASDITKYKPGQITVAGHTDTSGSKAYNIKLSSKRSAAVSAALTKEGVTNEVIDKKAYGEADLAVPTPDHTKNAENRRVVVDFRKDEVAQ